MTKYTIFCVLGLALLIAGAKHWMPGSKPASNSTAANSGTNEIAPLTNTDLGASLAAPPPASSDPLPAGPAPRQPNRSFTPGSTFLAQSVQNTAEPSPGKTEAMPPSVQVPSPQPAPLALPTTYKPQPREASPSAGMMAPLVADATVQPRLPTELAAASAESASMISDATARSGLIPSVAALKPLEDSRDPTTVQKQIHLNGDANAPISPYVPLGGPTPGQQQPMANNQWNDARNPDRVKADSLNSHNLLLLTQHAYKTIPEQFKLEGKELALQDLFIITQDPGRRVALLKAYWKAALAMTEYHWAFEENTFLTRMNAVRGQTTASHRYIEAAIFSSISRVSETRTQAINAQFELLALMGGQSRVMPICVDVPLVGTYNTQFDKNYPTGRAPMRLKAIAQTVDLRRDVINTRCLAIQTTFDAWKAAIEQYVQSPNPTEQNAQVIAIGYDQVTRHRRNFLAAIREYNGDIAEYAMSVLSPTFRPEQLARSLTRTPSAGPLWNTSAMITSESAEAPPSLNEIRRDDQVRTATFSNESAGEDWSLKTREPLPSVMRRN